MESGKGGGVIVNYLKMQQMKKLLATFFAALVCTMYASAQAPEKINYQGVARDNSGTFLANQLIGLRITLHSGSPSGPVSYQETHSVTTNGFGYFDLHIGGGTVVSGNFSTINWGTASYYNEVEMDVSGGTNYVSMGSTQLVSVPYALYAKTSGNNSGGNTYFVLAGDITDAEAIQRIENEVGPQTQFIWVINTTQLTTLDFPNVTELVEVKIQNNSLLTSVSFPDLESVWTNCLLNGTSLNSIDFPSLENVSGNLDISEANLASLSFPALTKTGNFQLNQMGVGSLSLPQFASSGLFSVSYTDLQSLSVPVFNTTGALSIHNNDNLLSANFPALMNTTTGYFRILENTALNSVNLPVFASVNNMFNIRGNTALATLNLPTLNHVGSGGFVVVSNPNLSTLTIPALTSLDINSSYGMPYFTTGGNALPSSIINSILAQLVSIAPPITDWMIVISAQTPAAPPTGQGIADKATLINSGNSVTTD